MNFYDYKKNELLDKNVIEGLKNAIALYEDGAICECRDILVDISDAISDFEDYTDKVVNRGCYEGYSN